MRPADLWSWIAVGVAGVGVGLIAVASPQIALALALALAIAAVVVVLARLLPPSPISPVYIAMALYLVAGVAGALTYALLRTSTSGAVPGYTDKITFLPPDLIVRTAMVYGIAALCTALGAMIVAIVAGGRAPALSVASLRLKAAQGSGASWLVLVFLGLTPLVLVVLGLNGGIGYLLERPEYIAGRLGSAPLLSLGTVLSFAMVACAGYVWSTAVSPPKRWWALGLAGAYMLVFLGLGSRHLSVIPLVFAGAAFAANPASRRLRLLLAGSAVLVVPLLALALYLRSARDHGLLAVPAVVAGGDSSAVIPSWSEVQINLLNTFGSTGGTAWQQPALPIGDFWVSVNPLPGGAAGWHGREALHRFDPNTPYSALGELGNYGTAWLCSYFLVFGGVLAAIDLRARALVWRGRTLPALGIIALACLAPVVSLQYDLRTTSRVLYYTGAVILLALAIPALRRRSVPQALAGERGPALR